MQKKTRCFLWSKAVATWVYWTRTTITARWAMPTRWRAARRYPTTVFRKETRMWIIHRHLRRPSSRITLSKIGRSVLNNRNLWSGRKCYHLSTRSKRGAFTKNSNNRRWRRRPEPLTTITLQCTTTTAAAIAKHCRRPIIQIWTIKAPSNHNSRWLTRTCLRIRTTLTTRTSEQQQLMNNRQHFTQQRRKARYNSYS